MKQITRSNLMSAFAGESRARMWYLLFSEIGKREKLLLNVRRLFRAVHRAEKIHAGIHFRNLRHLGEGEVPDVCPISGATKEIALFAKRASQEGKRVVGSC